MAEPTTAPERGTSPRGRRARAKAVSPTRLKLALAGVAPAVCVVWFLLMGEERRERVLAQIPEGAGDRAFHAAVAFGALAVLAWLLLPCVHTALVGTRRVALWLREGEGRGRILLAPARLVAVVVHATAGLLFFLNALLILIAFLLTCLAVVWIGFPGFLGGEEWLRGALGRLAESAGGR